MYLARYNTEDPYDLKIVEFSKIKQDNLKEYYTLRYVCKQQKRILPIRAKQTDQLYAHGTMDSRKR